MARPVKPYAQRIVRSMRADIAADKRRTLPAVDTAEVVSLKGGVQIQPSHSNIVYDEDDILWNVDPQGLKVGDLVTISRDPVDNPIVIGLVDAMQPDPALHPTHIKLKKDFDTLKGNARTWKAPVSTFADLPEKGNSRGDVRLVTSSGTLYRWNASAAEWQAIAGGGGGPVAALDDLTDVTVTGPVAGQILFYNGTDWVNSSLLLDNLADAQITAPAAGHILQHDGSNFVNVAEHWVDNTGDTMSGDLIMDSGTMITLPDAPVDPTDVVNKAYVDAAIAAAIGGLVVIPTIVVATNYTVTPADQVVLVHSCVGGITITLPASHADQKVYEIKDWSGCAASFPITIDTADADTIDGAATATINVAYGSITVISDGSNWYII